MPYRYRKTSYRCSECKLTFDKLRKFSTEKYPEGTDLPFPKKDPECPECKKVKKVNFKTSVTDDQHKHIRPDYVFPNDGKAFSMGGSAKSAAFDRTAEIVMKDYGLTDINMNSNLRPGDDCVPKLRPDLEAKVSKGWGGGDKKPMMGQAGSSLNSALTQQINSGAFKNHGDVVARQQRSGIKVPVNVIGEYNGKPS